MRVRSRFSQELTGTHLEVQLVAWKEGQISHDRWTMRDDKQTDRQKTGGFVYLPEGLLCSGSRKVSRIQVIQVMWCRASMVSVVTAAACSLFINHQTC